MKHWVSALKLLQGLVNYSQFPSRKFKIKRSFYPGIDDSKIPAIDIFPENDNQSTIIVLYHGASPFAEEHPGMLSLGQSMANAGVQVHIPRLPLLKELEITNENIDWIAHHFNWIKNKDENKDKIVIPAGISFAGGLLLKAILHPLIAPNPPKSLFTYGTYFDFHSSIKFLITGEINHDGNSKKIIPNNWGLIVLFHNYLKFIDPGFDSIQMRDVLKLRVQNKVEASEIEMLILPETQQRLLRNIFSAKITPEIENLIEDMINVCDQRINELSPANWGNKIKIPVFIMHGTNDNMIPYTESILLSECIENSHLFISNMYEHREISTKHGMLSKVFEMLKLISFLKQFIKFNAN